MSNPTIAGRWTGSSRPMHARGGISSVNCVSILTVKKINHFGNWSSEGRERVDATGSIEPPILILNATGEVGK
jgi:hypothetical protein